MRFPRRANACRRAIEDRADLAVVIIAVSQVERRQASANRAQALCALERVQRAGDDREGLRLHRP